MRTMNRTLAASVLALCALAGCDGETGETVGPRGGVVFSDDGRVTLEVPEGALADDVDISIHRVDDGPEGAVGPTYEIHPLGTTFSAPATLVYDVSEGMDAPMDHLTVVTESASGWSELSDLDADVDDQVIYASVLYLSAYAPVAD
jgi:hypothetical protein